MECSSGPAGSEGESSQVRVVGLDVLRMVAVVMVLGRHMHLPQSPNALLVAWQKGGWVGVDVFFVLSGFLVSSLMFQEYQQRGTIDIKRFLIRRGFKIYPAFWVFLSGSVVVNWCLDVLPSRKNMLAELFFLQNYLGGVWSHTWSLAVEEHFYLAAAGVAALWCSSRISCAGKSGSAGWWGAGLSFAVIASVCLLMRIYTWREVPTFDYKVHLIATHLRLDSLCFGVLMSYLCRFHGLSKTLEVIPSWVLASFGVCSLVPAYMYSLEEHCMLSVLGVMLFYVGGGALVLLSLRINGSSWGVVKIVGLCGAASYSIYLWHLPIEAWSYRLSQWLAGKSNAGYWLYVMLYYCGSCMVGLAMSRLVERPVLHMRDVLFPRVAARGSL